MEKNLVLIFVCFLTSCNILNLDGSKPVFKVEDESADISNGLDAWGYDPLSTTHVSTWDMTGGDQELTLPIPNISTATYNFTIDWGDGNTSTLNDTGNNLQSLRRHTYANPGIYTIEINGTFEIWKMHTTATTYVSGDYEKLIRVHSMGDLNFTNLESAFHSCTNLTHFAGGYTSLVTDMQYMFYQATSLQTLDTTTFNTSSVTNMTAMFQDISSVSSLDLSHFDTSFVLDMTNMLLGASSLQDLYVTGWDTSHQPTSSSWIDGTPGSRKIYCFDPDDKGLNQVNGVSCTAP
jgi:surface protein